MRRNKIITGLDIGSSKIAAVVAEMDAAGEFNVIAHVTCPSRGVYQGAIEEIGGASNSVKKAFDILRAKIECRPDNIYVNINHTSIKGDRTRGMIPIALRGREVTRGDMRRCIGAASTMNLPVEREIIHRVVTAFSVDDQPCVRSPLGLVASRLSCEAYIVTAGINTIQNIYKCVASAGYEIKDIVYTGIAEGYGILSGDDKEFGAAVIDIGASLTTISIFKSGALVDLEVMDFGSTAIKGDFKGNPAFDSMLARVSSRITEFFGKEGKVPNIKLTGGMVFTDGASEYIEEKLAAPVRVGIVKDVKGDLSGLDSMRLTVAIGLARYGYEHLKKKAAGGGSIVRRLSEKVTDIFNSYF